MDGLIGTDDLKQCRVWAANVRDRALAVGDDPAKWDVGWCPKCRTAVSGAMPLTTCEMCQGKEFAWIAALPDFVARIVKAHQDAPAPASAAAAGKPANARRTALANLRGLLVDLSQQARTAEEDELIVLLRLIRTIARTIRGVRS